MIILFFVVLGHFVLCGNLSTFTFIFVRGRSEPCQFMGELNYFQFYFTFVRDRRDHVIYVQIYIFLT